MAVGRGGRTGGRRGIAPEDLRFLLTGGRLLHECHSCSELRNWAHSSEIGQKLDHCARYL